MLAAASAPGVTATGEVAHDHFDVAREANKKLYVIMALLALAKEKDLGSRLNECLAGRAGHR